MLEMPPKEAVELMLAGQAPSDIRTGVLQFGFDKKKKSLPPLPTLPSGLHCYSLLLAGQPITTLPPGLKIGI